MSGETDKQKISRLESELRDLRQKYTDVWTEKTRAERLADEWQTVAGDLAAYLRTLS